MQQNIMSISFLNWSASLSAVKACLQQKILISQG